MGKGIDCKVHEKTFLGNGNVLHLELSGSYKAVCFDSIWSKLIELYTNSTFYYM